jgi:hypothetical protein
MPHSIVHVSVKLTERSRVTMRSLRLRRYCRALLRMIQQYGELLGEVRWDLLDRLDELSMVAAPRGP